MFSLKSAIVVAIVSAVVYYGFNCDCSYKHVTVETKFGQLQGYLSKSRDGRTFSSFKGIPYAKPPVGPLRFQPPIPVEKWDGVRDATKLGSVCAQFDTLWRKNVGEEDCLYLNVYTPKMFDDTSDQMKLIPVIVFIHGGHFMYGSSNMYGPQYFMDEDVVIVTINYRLGALGFLNNGPNARGNMGLKDQNMALLWVKESIKDFGGDPNLVTLMGESAGGASVNYHMISSFSDGLFHRAISLSGTALCPWAFKIHTKEQGRILGEKVGCPTSSINELMSCLKQVPAHQIVDTQGEMLEVFHRRCAAYLPSAEFDDGTDNQKIFVHENPQDSMASGQLARIPWLLNVLPEEGCVRTAVIVNNEKLLNNLSEHWNNIIPDALLYNSDPSVNEKVKTYYFGTGKGKFTSEDYNMLTRMYSDRLFFTCTHDAALLHAQNSPTYLSILTYKSGKSYGQALAATRGPLPAQLQILIEYARTYLYEALGWNLPDYGVCHVDDLQYLFSMISLWDIPKNSPHYEFSKDFVKLIVSFAKNGRPSKFRNVQWDKVNSKTKDGLKYLNLNKKPEMVEENHSKGIQFWKSLNFQM